MAENCFQLRCPEYIRGAQIDCSGTKIGGTTGFLVSCARNVTLEAQNTDQQVSEFLSDCGYVVVEDVIDARTKSWNFSFEIANISPELDALLNGNTLLQTGGVNVGTLVEGAGNCASAPADPLFEVDLFYKIGGCPVGATATHYRMTISGVRFSPAIYDKEGQITFVRYEGRSQQISLASYVAGATAGAYEDVPAGIEADLSAVVAANPLSTFTSISYVDPTPNPLSALTLEANTCYMLDVPAAA